VNNWIPVTVALVAAATALAGYLVNNGINRRVEKARYYAEALNAVERYGALPYIFKRRHDSSKETRAELAKIITDIQAALRFYQGWLELDSPVVGAAYNRLVDKMREKNSEYRKEALSSPPAKEDKDIEITPYDYNAKAEQDHCIAVMRHELKLLKWPKRYRLTAKLAVAISHFLATRCTAKTEQLPQLSLGDSNYSFYT
jgi:hypothetical protein